MRRLPLLLSAVPLLVAAPAQAVPPLAATFAGVGWEICPASPGFPCSYEGSSLVCTGATIIDLRTPYAPDCTTHLTAATGPCADSVTSGTFTYRDDLSTEYVVKVSVRNGQFSGSTATEEGLVEVRGTLHPFAGTVTRVDKSAAAPAPAPAGKGNCPVPV